MRNYDPLIAQALTISATAPAKTLGKEIKDYNEFITNKEAMPIIARNLRAIRTCSGILAKEIAESFEITKQMVSNQETGRVKFNNPALSMAYIIYICALANPKGRQAIIWNIALKCLDKAFRVDNSDYNLDDDLNYLAKLTKFKDLDDETVMLIVNTKFKEFVEDKNETKPKL